MLRQDRRRGECHRQRALRAILELAEQQVHGCACDLRAGTRVGPGARVHAGLAAERHQRVVSGMKFDGIRALAVAVVGQQLRRVAVRVAGQCARFRTAGDGAECAQRILRPGRAESRNAGAERSVGVKEVAALVGRRLVRRVGTSGPGPRAHSASAMSCMSPLSRGLTVGA